ncbi:ORF045 [Escherichia phage T5]|uniref:ORF045 n=1 Tax=Escherichia phage T5 TaxID=2695836 RepID=Q5DMP9_BPT5|nr:ORF045 [Escherichia phage T5]
MTIVLILVTTWFLIGAGYAVAILRHLDEYSAEWFIKHLRIDNKEHEFENEKQRKAVEEMTGEECLFYMRAIGFLGLFSAGPLGFTIAPYKETWTILSYGEMQGYYAKLEKLILHKIDTKSTY